MIILFVKKRILKEEEEGGITVVHRWNSID